MRKKYKLKYKRNNSASVAEYRRICKEVKREIKSARLDYESKLARSKKIPNLSIEFCRSILVEHLKKN